MEPIAFTLFGLDVHWYGIIIALGIVCAVVLACFNAKKRDFTSDDPFEIIMWVFLPAVLGARLYYLIFNGGPWNANAFAIWDGGLAVYGSIIGGAIGGIIYCLARKKSFLKLADLAVPSVILGQAIGRWGCYFAGCCRGEIVTNTAWQFFPISYEISGVWYLATFFYESILCLIACALLTWLLKKVKWRGLVFGGYMLLYGLIRFFLEGIRYEPLMWGDIRVSQLLSLFVILAGIAMIIFAIVKNKNQPLNFDKFEIVNEQPKIKELPKEV